MIEVTDSTIREANCNYRVVCDLMGITTWMLESKVFIDSGIIVSLSLIHFWSDGKVMIMSTDHPIVFDAPDDDIRELSNWCNLNGWAVPSIHKDLLENPVDFEYWLRLYRSGLVTSEELKMYDDNEMSRFTPEKRN